VTFASYLIEKPNIGYESVLEAMKGPVGVVRVQIEAVGVTVGVRESISRGYENIEEPTRVCKTHEVVLEEVEWTKTGQEESACRGHESTCKDHESAL
jgi:hypothetical protein